METQKYGTSLQIRGKTVFARLNFVAQYLKNILLVVLVLPYNNYFIILLNKNKEIQKKK